MTYSPIKLVPIIGFILVSGRLIGACLADLRSRQVREVRQFAEAVRNIAVFYNGVVVPGALLLLGSGGWVVVEFYGGRGFRKLPWLAGMVGPFLFEFAEGNTVTRLYFMRLRRLTKQALLSGQFTPEFEKARGETVPTFRHFLDLPMLVAIVAMGALKPETWTLFAVGSVVALAVATARTRYVPGLYPWGSERAPQ